MKLYAPRYYKKFKCIADKCPHCCCIGWEIDIDARTLEKYAHLDGGYADAICESISADGVPHFTLSENERCPHLDENGLCRIISSVGEDYLCDICREHPRFYNFTSVAEVGIGMSCAEAARIILSSPDYALLDEIGDLDSEFDGVEFDGRAKRSEIYAMLSDTSRDYQAKLEKIYHEYSIDAHADAVWLAKLGDCEYLADEHKNLLMNYSSSFRPSGKDEYLERFLAYFIYRHCTEAFDSADFRARLSFCLFCERLFASLIAKEEPKTLTDIAALAGIISEELEYCDENTLALTY